VGVHSEPVLQPDPQPQVGALPRSDRNSFSARRELPFRASILLTVLGGMVVLSGAAGRLDAETVLGMQPAFWAVCALLLGVELRPLFTAGARDPNGHLLTSAFVFALLLRYGLDVAVLVQAVATTAIDLSQRKALWRIAFNVSQYALSWWAAAAAMALLGFAPSAAPQDLEAAQLLPAAVGGLTYFVVNQLLVVVVVALKVGRPWWLLLREDLAYEGVSNAALLALSPLIVLAVEEGTAFLPLLLPPLVVVYKVGAVALDRERQAMTDALTGLPNRKRLAERAAEAFEEQDGPGPALLLFDLDRFKEVNDTLGHHVGDRLLVLVGSRLTAAVREVDSVARLGGDEFAVLLPGTGSEAAEQTARRLLAELSAPIVLEGLLVDVRASVGVAVAPQHGEDLDELLQHADVAMYLAKEQGGGVEQYDVLRDRNSTDRLVMVGELRRALTGDELEVHYQPKADLRTGRVDGVEALVRWRHPERGLVPPDEFVPLAESCGLVEVLTARVLDAAVEQLAAWHAQGLQLSVAVNVSVRDLAGGQLVDRVTSSLLRHGVAARWLQLEVTEGSLFADSTGAATTLRELDELGVALSLDDFGTGYSSLGHLRRLPVQELKIDRSFVQRMGDDPRDRAIVRSVVDLAEGLGMRVVAEGVEDLATWQALRELGCDVAQGWYVCRPQAADVLTPWLHARDRAFAAG
jgi:diguanylate cyclase (GGDEF)-like protein